ncbi:MAG: hypothetical protein WD669_10390 [Pirellulales bacterium]
MKTTATKLIAIVSMSAVVLAATTAAACPKGGYGGGYSNYNTVYVKKVYVAPVYTCYRPLHCFVFVLPGDTWATISQREYGSPKFWPSIASFNGLGGGTQLFVGQQIRLPEIHPSGALTASSAPAPAPFAIPTQSFPIAGTPNMLPNAGQGLPLNGVGLPVNGSPMIGSPISGASPVTPNGSPIVSQNFVNAPIGNAGAPIMNASAPMASMTNSVPSANIRLVSAEPSIPSVAIGSELLLDGQSLGEASGSVRLRLSGVALKVEVLDWSAEAVKIRLPELDLAAAMRAELEVLRADGSLASKSAVQLTPAGTKLAQGN